MSTTGEIDATFGALADPTRRRVVELLRGRPHRASELADACDASRPAMSRHLRVLRTSGLVETDGSEHDLEVDARARTYRLRRERFTELRDWLEEVDRFWTGQLAAFAAHVDKRSKSR